MAYGVIYKITNKLNGRNYVGQTTKSIKERFNQHANNKKSHIGRAIIKYGVKKFSIEVLEDCETQEQLNEREIFWIAKINCKHPNGYNQTDGGEGTLGFSHTTETRKLQAELRKGFRHTKKTKAKMSIDRRRKSPYKNLINEIEKLQLSYKELAKLLNLCPTSVSYKLIGKYNFTDKNKAKLEKFFGIPIEYLLQHDEFLVTLPKKNFQTPFKNLLDLITKQNFSYCDLAKILGVSVSSVSLKMRGKQNFTARDKAKLVEIFGKPIEYLLARDDS